MTFGKREAPEHATASRKLAREETPIADAPAAAKKAQLSPVEMVACGWPIALAFMGGAIGGACGGGAWAINMQIMKSDLSPPLRYGLTVLVGLGAFAAYFVAVVILAILFPGVFKT
jgi:hypothetical protein